MFPIPPFLFFNLFYSTVALYSFNLIALYALRGYYIAVLYDYVLSPPILIYQDMGAVILTKLSTPGRV